VAPGAHLVSLRSPGSAIDEEYPGSIAGAYRRGSGTSMSAAVVSGGVALALQANPAATPDEVKESLRVTARAAASDDPMAVGSGELAAYAAATRTPDGRANAGAARSDGRGSLDASRGTSRVATGTVVPVVVSGLQTAQLMLWDPVGLLSDDWTPDTWYVSPAATGVWRPVYWSGSNWGGSNWGGSNWGGSNWYGQDEESSSYGETWRGGAWYGAWE
jgi:serine protease AprX